MKKKDYNSYLLVELIIIVLKVFAGVFGHSMALLCTILYDVVGIITTYIAINCKEETTKGRMIGTAFYSFIVCLLALALIFISFKSKIFKPSLLILIFLLLCLVLGYVVTIYNTNRNYNKKEGLLGLSSRNSNINLILYIVVLASIILSKLRGLWGFFKYSDRIGVVIICLFTIYYGLRILLRSFRKLEDKVEEKVSQKITEEVNKCKEVKNITKIEILSNGGIRRINVDLKLQPSLAQVDLITFIVTLQDYLLKYSDLVTVNLVKHASRSGAKKSAGNSRGSNSKKSTKKKSTKKKNKKR